MLRSKKLALRKETLSELSAGVLQQVVGASVFGVSFNCTRDIDCVNDISFEICPTLGIEECLRTELCSIVTR
ncbi:MAG TPA: class I lanthipeptide [Mycobacteriales bacterium]|jgi:hypothetical protein